MRQAISPNRKSLPGAPVMNNYRGPIAAPHNAFRTLGGGYNDWCVIACLSDEEWSKLVGLMNGPAWATDSKFATLDGRLLYQDEMDQEIEKWTLTLAKYELADKCQAAGVRAIGVSWGYHEAQELLDTGASAVADTAAQLGEMIRGPA